MQKGNTLAMRDNAELKKISRKQEELARAATQNSVATYIIATITMWFLPGTFTAVCGSYIHNRMTSNRTTGLS
jgi:hypothetical protein